MFARRAQILRAASLKKIWADAAYRGQELAEWCQATGEWELELDFSRTERMSKDYERKVQTSETLIQVAMIRLLLARLARHLRTSSQPSALGHKPFPMAFGDNFDDAINHL